MSQVDQIRDALGFKPAGALHWKKDSGYLVIMGVSGGVVRIEFQTGLKDSTMPMAIGEVMNEIDSFDYIRECIINGPNVYLSFEDGKISVERLQEIYQDIVEALTENRIEPITICKICNQELDFDPKLMRVNNDLILCHSHCFDDFREKIEDAKTNSQGSYITGAIGAVIGGAVGSIPWIIVGILGWFVSILGFVISAAAVWGYNKMNGRQGKPKAVILVVVVVAMVVMASFIGELYELYQFFGEMGYEDIPLGDAIEFIFLLMQEDGEYMRGFMFNTVLGIVFGILGARRVIMGNAGDNPVKHMQVELIEE